MNTSCQNMYVSKLPGITSTAPHVQKTNNGPSDMICQDES